MSIALEVKLTMPITIRAFLPKIGKALQEILELSFVPKILAEEYVDRKWVPLESDVLTKDSRLIGILIEGEPETVSVFAHSRAQDRLINEHGVFAIVEVTGPRTPLILALTAAVAVALGRECGTEVADNMPFFSNVFDRSSDDFVKAIQVKDSFDDYRAAAESFYGSLPAHSTVS